MFHVVLLVVSSFFAGMMVFAGWEAWLAYRAYMDSDGDGVPSLPTFPSPASMADLVQIEDGNEASNATPEPPAREVDEETLAAIASADHYLNESELDEIFGPSSEESPDGGA